MHMRLICPVHLYRIHYGTTFNVSVVLYLIFLIYIMKIEGANIDIVGEHCNPAFFIFNVSHMPAVS